GPWRTPKEVIFFAWSILAKDLLENEAQCHLVYCRARQPRCLGLELGPRWPQDRCPYCPAPVDPPGTFLALKHREACRHLSFVCARWLSVNSFLFLSPCSRGHSHLSYFP